MKISNLTKLLHQIYENEVNRFVNITHCRREIPSIRFYTESYTDIVFTGIRAIGYYCQDTHEIALFRKGQNKQILIHEITHALGHHTHDMKFDRVMCCLMKKYASKREYEAFLHSPKRHNRLKMYKNKDKLIAYHQKELDRLKYL